MELTGKDPNDDRSAAPSLNGTVCPGCSLRCDDVKIEVSPAGGFTQSGVCGRGRDWLARQQSEGGKCRVAGQETSLESALARACEILRAAKSPLICGLDQVSIEAQQELAELARSLRGAIDVSWGPGNELSALQHCGRSTATLGQIARHAEVAVFWNYLPHQRHPRLVERHLHQIRHFIVCHEYGNEFELPARLGDRRVTRILMDRNSETAVVDRIRLIVDESVERGALTSALAGLDAAAWQDLIGELKQAVCQAWFIGGQTGTRGEQLSLALHRLVRRLNNFSKAYYLKMSGDGNAVGAEDVLAWNFGFANAVNLNQSQARSHIAEFSARDQLLNGKTDALLAIVGADSRLAGEVVDAAGRGPRIVLHSRDTELIQGADVSIEISQLGWDEAGDICRLDDIALTQPGLTATGRPTCRAVVASLMAKLSTADGRAVESAEVGN